MGKVCRILIAVFAVAYAAVLFLLAVGTFGWFGQERDPLSAVFLVPLGLPWNQVTGMAPEGLLPALAIAAPAVNLLILWGLCRALSRGAAP